MPPVGGLFMNIITYPHSGEARHLYPLQTMFVAIFTPKFRRDVMLTVVLDVYIFTNRCSCRTIIADMKEKKYRETICDLKLLNSYPMG